MAKATALIPGMEVLINAGNYEGHTATVIDPLPIPDGGDHRAPAVHQRKVLVKVNDLTVDGAAFQTYILPRLLDLSTGPIQEAAPAPLAEAALTVVSDNFVVSAKQITDPMDPALDRFRPDPRITDQYIRRMLPGGYTDVELLLRKRDQRDDNGYSPNIAFVGETQSGKSMLVKVLAVEAAKRDGMPKPYPVFTLNGSSGITSYDLFGQPTAVLIDGKETLVWMEGLLAIATRVGGLLNLEEWNAVPPGQAVSIHPVLDDTRRFTNTQKAVPDGYGGFMPEEVKVNPNLWILCTINPGYKGTQVMAEASTNRFVWLPWDYDDDVERALVPSKTVRIIGAALRDAGHARIITVPVGTSALQRFAADCHDFGVDYALWSFLAMFPPNERERAKTIIEDSGKEDLLREEFPNPAFAPSTDDRKPLADTWNATNI
jgi:hypothetical protein